MDVQHPRIPPLPPEQWTDEVRDLFTIVEGEQARTTGSRYNTILVLMNHPALARDYLGFSHRVLRHSSLPDRLRELITLRTASLCGCEYVLVQHRIMGGQMGLSPAEIEAAIASPEGQAWSPLEAAALRAAEQLHRSAKISDETWAVLAEQFDQKQLLEFVFTVGNYVLYSMYLNNVEAQVEPEFRSATVG